MNNKEDYYMTDYLIDCAVFLRKYTIVQVTKSMLFCFCSILLLKKGMMKR